MLQKNICFKLRLNELTDGEMQTFKRCVIPDLLNSVPESATTYWCLDWRFC